MRWKYHLTDKSKRIYVYAYSRESDELDGLISFDVEKQSASMMRPSKTDVSSKNAQAKAIEHFWTVVNEGFPVERYVSCG